MPVSRRYTPEWSPDELSTIGMDFSFVIPPGVGITGASLFIRTNSAAPVDAHADWAIGGDQPADPNGFFQCQVSGRTVYVFIAGGFAGKDYKFVWTVQCTDGSEFARSALLLCSDTS